MGAKIVINSKTAMQSLGRIIQGQRTRMQLSQTEVADLAKVSLNFVSQIESGKPTAQICKVLDVLGALGLCFSVEYGKNHINNRIIEEKE